MSSGPFRWDPARREQLGGLVTRGPRIISAEFLSEVRETAVRVVAAADAADLVFVGRSLDDAHDYLGGIFEKLPGAPGLSILAFSAPFDLEEVRRRYPAEFAVLKARFAAAGLAPRDLAARGVSKAFVDVVARGITFAFICDMLKDWSREEGVDWASVRRNIRFVGLTRRTKNSPNTWRWLQKKPWTDARDRPEARSLSISYYLWYVWGDAQEKMTPSSPVWMWGRESGAPARDEDSLKALNRARNLHVKALAAAERQAFHDALAKTPEYRSAPVRRLGLLLKSRRSARR